MDYNSSTPQPISPSPRSARSHGSLRMSSPKFQDQADGSLSQHTRDLSLHRSPRSSPVPSFRSPQEGRDTSPHPSPSRSPSSNSINQFQKPVISFNIHHSAVPLARRGVDILRLGLDNPERLQQVRRNLERHRRILAPAGSGYSNLQESPFPCSGKKVGLSSEDSEGPASTISEPDSGVTANGFLQDQVKKSTYWSMEDPELHRCDCPNCPYRSLDNLQELEEELQSLCESPKDDPNQGITDSPNSTATSDTSPFPHFQQLASTSSTSTSSSTCELHIIRDYESMECHTGESENEDASSTRPLLRYSCTSPLIEIIPWDPDSPDPYNGESEDEGASGALSPFPDFCKEVRIDSPSRKSAWVMYEPILSPQANFNLFNEDKRTPSPSSSISNAGSDETSQPRLEYRQEMKELMGKYPFSYPPVEKDKVLAKARYAACWLEGLFGASSKERRDKLEDMIVMFFDPDSRDAKKSHSPVVEDTTELHPLSPAIQKGKEGTESKKENPCQHIITALAKKILVPNPHMVWETALQSATQSMSWYSDMLSHRRLYDEKLTTVFKEETVIEFFGLEKWMEEK